MRHSRLRIPLLLLVVTLFAPLAPILAWQPSPAVDAAELELALRRLQFLGSVLYVAAHPDDENTALLAYLAQGRLARTAYLSVTRGDGGQNLIGPETGERLGMIRTQELLQARQLDGAEQFFTRAVDFGYTRSVEETLKVWGREEILADVVRVMRRYRPDVVITRFPGDGRGGHGQHTASAVLALEAFGAAADPARFPEQLADEGLEPWQAKRLLWDSSRFFGSDRRPPAADEIAVDVGEYLPLLGESSSEIAARSRTMHKSQGFGSAPRRGTQPSLLVHRLGEPAAGDLFDGVDTTWKRVPGGEGVGTLLAEAVQRFDSGRPGAVVPILARAWTLLEGLPPSPWVTAKRAEVAESLRAAAGLWLAITAERPSAAPGQPVELTIETIHRSSQPFRLVSVGLPFGGEVEGGPWELVPHELMTVRGSVVVPGNEPPTQPYWLRRPSLPGRYTVEDPTLIGMPEDLPYLGQVILELDGRELTFDLPVVYRWTDRVDGERYRPFAITPPVLVEVEGAVHLFPESRSRPIRLVVRQPEGHSVEMHTGAVSLALPAGWRSVPEKALFALPAGRGERLELEVIPPPDAGVGMARANVALGSEVFSQGMSVMEYSHIPTQVLFPLAEARLVRLELKRSKLRVGYVPGAGDKVPEALRQIGYEVSLLGNEQLVSGELGEYETIVVGVRAYNVNPQLVEHNDRLLDYVAAGGTLVVQYNTASRGPELDSIGPYPFTISRDRVSVETAQVTLVDPSHPILQQPNRIGPADFEDWVQERGLYFAGRWDDGYTPILGSHDPGEPDRLGGLLVAQHGKGIYIYTGYSFFRQLPAGVPGAFRLFVNLIEASG